MLILNRGFWRQGFQTVQEPKAHRGTTQAEATMQFSSWPRHQLRAQGRRIRRPEEALPEEPKELSSGNSFSQSSRLLNFLSKSAAQSERAILAPKLVPEFAKLSTTSSLEMQRLFAQKRAEREQRTNNMRKQFADGRGVLDQLANTLTAEALSEGSAQAPANMTIPFMPKQPIVINDGKQSQKTISSALRPDCLAALDEWLSCASDPEISRERASQAGGVDPFLHRHVLPAALPAVLPQPYSGFDELGDEDEDIRDHNIKRELAGTNRPMRVVQRGARFKRAQFNRDVRYKPELVTLPHGARRETFENGAVLIKDALGRVIEIHSTWGTILSIRYDDEGQPQAFVRRDGHYPHSLGERDRHGVVVRDPEGRVRAAGESIAVDPSGCVSIRRFDGQFWSIDLVRGIHIERRNVADSEGNWYALTALFAFDGFRMVTRFQPLDPNERADTHSCLSGQPTGRFRFYGRDGSMIQFESEDHLVQLTPAKVARPGTRKVDSAWRGYLQAGTAWESVQEYVTSYLLA